MHIDVISLFPAMFDALHYGITGRALRQHQAQLRCWNPRDFSQERTKRVDDRPFGGGPGMVMSYQPLRDTLRHIKAQHGQQATQVIYLSPQGRPLKQTHLSMLSQRKHLILIAGRYEGIDERFVEQHVDEEWSVGDWVVSGGELPAMILIDGIIRLLPGVLGDAQSADQDSFSHGLLDCPHYTRPEVIDGLKVPSVLLSGNHQAIGRWRADQAYQRTWARRPDLIKDPDPKPLMPQTIHVLT